jgi:antitoxin component YwqK of YwqJK toxin-antitoxin module
MKKLLIFGFLIASLAFNAQVKLNDKGLYANADGSIFNGALSVEEDGVKKSTLQIKDGMIDGEAQYFFASTGQIMETGMFEKGQKHGKWIRYNEAGIVVGLAQYNFGKKHGTWTVFDDKGTKRFEMTYNNGDKSGIWNSWDEAGQVTSTKDYSQVH